jgi:hypothetical protein
MRAGLNEIAHVIAEARGDEKFFRFCFERRFECLDAPTAIS